MTIETLKNRILDVTKEYPISRIVLFGSRANGTNTEESDVDLIMEFSEPITLIMLSRIRNQLEQALELEVDIIHGPLRDTDLIEVESTVELYAA